MGGDDDRNAGRVFHLYSNAFEPTKEDIERKMSEQELKELCLRVPCCVLMYRWNAVHDYVKHFRARNRLQNKNNYEKNQLLRKAVTKNKDCVYTDDEINKSRYENWCQRKKDNILRLRLWEQMRKEQEEDIHFNGDKSLSLVSETSQIDNSDSTNAGVTLQQALHEFDVIEENVFQHYMVPNTESMSLNSQSYNIHGFTESTTNSLLLTEGMQVISPSPRNTDDFYSSIKTTSTQEYAQTHV